MSGFARLLVRILAACLLFTAAAAEEAFDPPLAKTVVRLDYHRFSLYSSQDAWYRANGVATVRPLNAAAQSAPRHAGDEVDLTVTWTPRPWAAVDVGYSKFNAGSYLQATGARSDADFFYLQTTLKF